MVTPESRCAAIVSIAIVFVSGCSPVERVHPIYGTWVLDVRATDPEVPEDHGIEGRMTFLEDGNRLTYFKWGKEFPGTDDVDVFVIDGEDVYLLSGERRKKVLCTIKEDVLYLEDEVVPGVLVFRRE